MKAEDFRRVALSLPEAEESAHMGHPDFRVRGKIFATLWMDGVSGVVMVNPEEQAQLLEMDAAAFTPAKGAWGRSGSTQVRLARVDEATARLALTIAWCRAAPKRLLKKQASAED